MQGVYILEVGYSQETKFADTLEGKIDESTPFGQGNHLEIQDDCFNNAKYHHISKNSDFCMPQDQTSRTKVYLPMNDNFSLTLY
jgi:hypothetical protein